MIPAEFPKACPAPLREGIVFEKLEWACPTQARGEARGYGFYFRARFGVWTFTISPPGVDPVEAWRRPGKPGRHFSAVDPWEGLMPPSVAFALVTSKLLWHICYPPVEEREEPDGWR